MFLETVDTRWDEWNRIAIKNARNSAQPSGISSYSNDRSASPGSGAAPTETDRPATPAEPPTPDYFTPPRFPNPPGDEPHQVPGAPKSPDGTSVSGPSAKQVLFFAPNEPHAAGTISGSIDALPRAVHTIQETPRASVEPPTPGIQDAADELLNLNSQRTARNQSIRLVGAQRERGVAERNASQAPKDASAQEPPLATSAQDSPRPAPTWLFSKPRI